MPGIFMRARAICEARTHRILTRWEDPRELLDLAYNKKVKVVRDAREALVNVATSRHSIRIEREKILREADQRARQAQQAVAIGRDDLAREALERKAALLLRVPALDGQLADLEETQGRM